MKITNLPLYLILNCKLSTVNCKLVLHPPFPMIEEIYQGGAYNKHNAYDDPECDLRRSDKRKNDIHSKKSGNKGQRKYY